VNANTVQRVRVYDDKYIIDTLLLDFTVNVENCAKSSQCTAFSGSSGTLYYQMVQILDIKPGSIVRRSVGFQLYNIFQAIFVIIAVRLTAVYKGYH
jgi:hypothetical protein